MGRRYYGPPHNNERGLSLMTTPYEKLPIEMRRVIDVLGIGADNALTGEQVIDRLCFYSVSYTHRQLRGVLKDLVELYGWPIAGSQTGFYIIANESERSAIVADLVARALSIADRVKALRHCSLMRRVV